MLVEEEIVKDILSYQKVNPSSSSSSKPSSNPSSNQLPAKLQSLLNKLSTPPHKSNKSNSNVDHQVTPDRYSIAQQSLHRKSAVR
jgi:hypothetical protein